jgi:hypothetical protein
MARSQVVASSLAVALSAVVMAAPSAQSQARRADAPAARPFEAVLPRIAATSPGTYVAKGTVLTPAPEAARIPVMVQADVLRGQQGPARVGIVVGAVASQAVDVRLRVWTVAAGAEAARVVADSGGSGTAGPMRLVRELSLAPGGYEVEAVVGYSAPGGGLVVAIARSRLTVPDVQGGSLVVTPIVAGDAANGPRRPDVPFTFGQTTITPAISSRFPRDGSISVAFRIYNWTAKADEEKPDLTVEYLFYEQGSKGLHFFNKVKPQPLTAATLGPAFDPSAGSVAAGMRIPLEAFTFGDFQLTVRVTDNRTHQTAEGKLSFAVVP